MTNSTWANGYATALPMNRTLLHGFGLSVGIAFALAGCAPESNKIPATGGFTWRGIQKACDHGRAVYWNGSRGGVAVIENASECRGK